MEFMASLRRRAAASARARGFRPRAPDGSSAHVPPSSAARSRIEESPTPARRIEEYLAMLSEHEKL
jgi:hypothetical protein